MLYRDIPVKFTSVLMYIIFWSADKLVHNHNMYGY